MRKRIFGVLSVVGAALWPLLWEFVRSLFYERGSHMLEPFINSITMDQIVHWGPSVGLTFLGLWLFWKTRAKGNAKTTETKPNLQLAAVFDHVHAGPQSIAKPEVEAAEKWSLPDQGKRAAILSKLRSKYSQRIILDVSPDFLMNLYKDKLTQDGDRAIVPYIGNWLLLFGPVRDVSRRSGLIETMVTFKREYGIDAIFMYFDDLWIDYLAVLRPNQNILALCQFRSANSAAASFDHCELIDQDSGLPLGVP